MSAEEFEEIRRKAAARGQALAPVKASPVRQAVSRPFGKFGHKFKAKRTELDGIKFASQSEALYYEYLKARQAAGEIVFFLRQVAVHARTFRYVVDFLIFKADGSCEFVDVKGFETSEFKLKKKEIEAIYPISIILAKVRKLRNGEIKVDHR